MSLARTHPPLPLPVVAAFLLLVIWGGIMPTRFRHMKNGQDTPLSLALKGVPTAMAVLFPLRCLLLEMHSPYPGWMLAGLLFCLAGDVVLSLHFVAGGGLFLLGHLCYVTGLLNLHPPGSIHLLIFTAALAVLLGLLLHLRKQIADRLLFYGVCVYAAALAALLAAALPLPLAAGSPQTWCAAAGALLFVISDITLCDNMLNARPVRNQYISLGIYYTAQILLGISTLAVL